MSDQYGSGNPDRPGGSGATPWNAADHDPSAPAGHDAQAASPSYSQETYPDSAYAQQGSAPAGGYGTSGGYGTPGDSHLNAQPAYGAPAAAGPYDGGYATYDKPKGLAIAALVLGILSLVAFWMPILGALLGLVAIILGAVALSKVKKGTAGGRGLAIAGVVTGVLGLLANLVVTALLGAVMSAVMQNGDFQSAIECTELPSQAQQQACLDDLSNSVQSKTDAPNT